jgi:uncharacterized circularly permuted ATP-grasp superfamily protein/uncharacterized alpha-E superfamily protein
VTPPSLFDTYAALVGTYDEMRDAEGAFRAHWRDLAASLDQLGDAELDHRRRETERLLRQDGVTYNVYDSSSGRSAPWVLDPIPMLIDSDEWATIERGLIQRAELLNLILTDLYGPRELVRKGLLPLEVVYGHRGFLRQCDQIRLPGTHQLVVYGADLARDVSGQTWVLNDFAQAPSGAGYALENRVVISRVFPSLYRDAQVHRLAPFFRALRASLVSIAPAGVDDPRIVVLTPGPLNETYYEHAYLARYLGYSLVEGSDLSVKDGRVFLRSLAGLEPVDVILRRVDGWYGDPLELKSTSQLGVPGLVDAARRGTVSVVNGFGSSVIENAGLLPFLPRLAQVLLGQDLRLPSTPTWWCGQPKERSHVMANLEQLVIKPIARRPGANASYGWELSGAQRDDLRARISARPHLYVAQERVAFSSVPCLDANGLDARPAMLRAFAVARDGSYLAMPGGLTRVSGSNDQLLSAQLGGVSKDTWVLASEPEKQSGTWVQGGPSSIAVDPAGSMPSRAAENLFWLGRYAERAEAVVRLVRAILDRGSDFAGRTSPAGTEALNCLLEALTHLTATYPGFVGDGRSRRLAFPEPELLSIITDSTVPGSVASSLRAMLAAANAVRDQLSNDTWLALGTVEHELDALDATLRDPLVDASGAVQASLATLVRSLLALAGLATESMVRDPGWHFLDAGRRIERGTLLATLLHATLVPVRSGATENLVLESVLVVSESIITYRRRYRSRAHLDTVLDLLLQDTSNPRSMAFQLDRLTTDIGELPRRGGARLSPDQRLVLELSTRLRVADTTRLATNGDTQRAELADLLRAVIDRLAETANAIDAEHFAHLAPRHVLFPGQPGQPEQPRETGA